MKRPQTSHAYFVQRIPADVKVRAAGFALRIPLGGGFVDKIISPTASDLRLSLRTSDASEAKIRHAAVAAYLEGVWKSLRHGPIHLTLEQVVALSAEMYQSFMRGAGTSAAEAPYLRDRKARLADARRPRLEPYEEGPDTERTEALERQCGRAANELIAAKGLIITPETRASLLDAIATAEIDALTALLKRLDHDFTPDPKASRFPAWSPPVTLKPTEAEPKAASTNTGSALTARKLFDLWSAKHQDRAAPSTIRRYRASWQSLIAFFGQRDVATFTSDDIYSWAEHRRDAEGASPGSINKNDLVAASSVFKWAMDRDSGRLVSESPVTGVRLKEPRKVLKRERTFREDEIRMLLTLASSVKVDPDNPTLSYAQRWCQWLAAYSGARIAEATGLTGADITVEEGVHVMRFRKTKTGIPRTVPLHAHLIEQGFLEFVSSRGKGPLFYDPSRHSSKATTNPADQRAIKMAAWVRKETSLEMDVDPNHGWRHTWKTRALGAGIEERLRDAIAGHGPGNVARSYETPTIGMLAGAIKVFPRYPVG